MIKDNVIYFGYGDILIGCYNDNDYSGHFLLTLTEIVPPQEIGQPVHNERIENGEISIVNEIKIGFVYEDLLNLREKLVLILNTDVRVLNITDEENVIVYVLNFVNYNPESVNVIIRAIDKAFERYYVNNKATNPHE